MPLYTIWTQDSLPTTEPRDATSTELVHIHLVAKGIVPANFIHAMGPTDAKNHAYVAGKSSSIALTFVFLCVSLAVGADWLSPTAVIAQTTSSMQPSLAVGSTRPEGMPLGATEMSTPGISPVNSSLGTGIGTCAGSSAASSGSPFDGGGLSGSASLPCATSRAAPSSAQSLSPVGRVEIPLGATELGNAGISPLTPVPGPTRSSNGIAAPTGSMQPNSNTGIP